MIHYARIIGCSGLEEAEYSCVMIAQSLCKDKSHEKPSEGPYVLLIAYGIWLGITMYHRHTRLACTLVYLQG